ncbi:hypothetical protein B0J12DRAFT_703158 [Macrophomina phaseolina]|uniref:Uncharacterized protein n=1 Tax=Macrophomina phaseolina TaxID=35725 RepID=A0ABQ8FZE9_9PEZI|nr:hypothetical protein B0J12DRAFT_703158 [Macrophomina phaseolina]
MKRVLPKIPGRAIHPIPSQSPAPPSAEPAIHTHACAPPALPARARQRSSFDSAGPTSAHALLRASRSTPDVQYTLPHSPHTLPALTTVTFVLLTSIRFPSTTDCDREP